MSLNVSNNQEVRFERGFKAWSENTAVNFRKRLRLQEIDPLDPVVLADHLAVRLWQPRDIPHLAAESIDHLESSGGDEWSAVSVAVGDIRIIVYNPSHTPARRASDIAHELAHIIRGHKPDAMVPSPNGIVFRTFNPHQEAEANWLAGCLLLPRVALEHCEARKILQKDACEQYGVSKDLFQYRRNITGISAQFSRTRSKNS